MGPKLRTLARILAFLAIFLVLSTGSIVALDPTSHTSQYGHSVWRVQDGYFGGSPGAITQTTDGYIWVGTDAGLFKFDGVRFVRWNPPYGEELPSSYIHALLGARDGSLWIGTDAGLAHLVSRQMNLYEKLKGWQVNHIVEDRDGKIWISRNRPDDKIHPLCQVLESDVHCYGSTDGLDVSGAGAIAQDASGDLWVGGEKTLVRWRAGASKVYRPRALQSNEGYGGVGTITRAADGTLWIGIDLLGPGGGLQQMIDGTLKPFRTPKLNGETLPVFRLYSDHQENLWVGTEDHGLYKIRGMDVDHYGSGEGLSSDAVREIFEDREENVWVATSQGLDMFRDLRVKSISAREGLHQEAVESVAAARDGRVWVGTDRMQVLDPKELTWDTKNLPGNQSTSLFVDHAGLVWTGMDNKLFVYEQGRFREITKQDGSPLGMIMGITEDSDRNIWVETGGPPGTLVRIRDLKVHEMFPAPKTPFARKIVADPQRGIWLGLVTGDLARFRDGQVQTFTFGEHPNSRVLAITAASDGSILGGTAFGVVAWKNGEQQILTVRNGLPCNYVSGLISDDGGNLWLFAQCGLIEIPRDQMQLWWEHPESKLNLRVLDTFDGFRPGLGHFNTSTKTPDGRLWFATGNVLEVVDPAQLSQNTVPPPVQISAVVADHKPYPPDAATKLPALTRDLEIDYAALSYVAPQKVFFRYMLEGRDAGFQEAGTRRQAFYNDLRPAHYRFRVVARNNDGVWNEAGASLDFSVLPAFYQTNWFLLLCGVAAGVLAWAVYRWRIGQVSTRLDSQFQGRLAERTRIAQDLHDTLLQGFISASMQLSVANRQLPADLPAKTLVTDVLEQMKNVIEEGRNAIQGMRLPSADSDDLDRAFLRMPQDLAVQKQMDFKVIVEGQSRPLHPTIRDEVYRIGREAVANAFHHAHASAIEIELEYADNQLRVVIRDDGCGIDQKTLKSGREGHWGLSGMRERARVIGATFKIWSNPAGGTEIELVVPGQVAYRPGSGKVSPRWLTGFRRRGVRSDSENKVSQ